VRLVARSARSLRWALYWSDVKVAIDDPQVATTVETAGTNLDETKFGIPTLVERFRTHPAIREFRRNRKIDIMILLIRRTPKSLDNLAGKVSELGPTTFLPKDGKKWQSVFAWARDHAFAAVETKTANEKQAWTFAHEVGHLLGAAHTPYLAGERNRWPGYAHVMPDWGFKTLMAPHTNKLVRLMEFSRPDYCKSRFGTLGGKKVKINCGHAESANNALVVRRNVAWIAQYGECLP
jgi:hypothetical protein